MPREQSPAARTTLYRLLGVSELVDGIRPKYLEGDAFEAEPLEVEGRSALLVVGSMVAPRATWAAGVERLTGTTVDVGNRTSAGVLVIRDGEDNAWALTYGMGFQLLEQRYVDPRFGQRVAIRAADPAALRSLTRTTLDHRSRTDRSSIPSGEQLRSFGVGDFGEIVSRVVGPAIIPAMTVGDGSVTIRGADALSVPLGRTPTALVADLDSITAVLATDPLPELESLEQLTPVKNTDVVATLEDELRAAIADPQQGRLALSWPHERIDENGTATSFRLHGAGRGNGGPFDDLPTLSAIRAALSAQESDDLLEVANTLKIQLFRDPDAEEPMSPAIPVTKWLAFELDLEGRRYCLHDGRWYLMDQDYAARLQRHVDEIFERDSGLSLPDWPADQAEEKDYNEAAAAAIGATLLDRDLIRTQLHRRGIEACDLITPDGLLIHVKNLSKSSAASHLIGQALVSTDALLYDEEARTKLREKIAAAGGDPTSLPDRPTRVAIAMARSVPLTAADLFTFTQVTLARLDASLAAAGVTVFVVPVLREQGS